MSENGYCPCGARILWVDERQVEDGLEVCIYTCGVCGNQIEVDFRPDPRKF